MNENLQKIEEFFNANLKIKYLLNSIANTNMEASYNTHYKIQYVSKVEDTLYKLKEEFYKIGTLLDIKPIIDIFFDNYKNKLENCNYDYYKIKDFIMKYLLGIREQITDDIKRNFFGYSLARDNELKSILLKCISTNELLHVLHFYIINNEQILESVPRIAYDKYDNGYSDISLYGKDNAIAKSLFIEIPRSSRNGWTDILGLSNKVIIMVRDRGHALSIEIEQLENDKIYVKYFIPKICNIEMVNNLPGVRKVNNDSIGTIGEFLTDKDNCTLDIIKFIESVPTDKDMIFYDEYSNISNSNAYKH